MAKQKYTVEHVISALRETKGMVYLAADRIGCHADTILNYAKRYKSVQDEIDSQREKVVDIAELKLYQAIMDGNEGMVKYLLSTRGKKRGYTTGTEISGPDGGPFTAKVEHAINSETAATIFDILAAAGALTAVADDAEDDGVHST
jgi:hypothetical protein